jgi:hypothetical protein
MRVVDKRREPFTRYIGRGSDLGNPFTHLPLSKTKAYVQVATVDEAVVCCKNWAQGNMFWDNVIPPSVRTKFLAAIKTLKAEDILGCYCKPKHACHGDIIVELWDELFPF